MSGFSQLMMRKKAQEEPNYITLSVIGSLTINNGIVSGFSNHNYLMTPTINRQTTWTQVFCFTTPASISDMMSKGIYQEYISETYRTRNSIDQNNGTGLKNFMTNNNSGWNIGAETVNNVFSTSTTYYLKTEFTGTQYITSIKTTGDYTVLSTFNSTEKWRNLPLIIGSKIDSGGDEGFKGTFNIKESYMILDGVKYEYEFKFAIPLTIVGSPTITDGVVSGFSANNYLTMPMDFAFGDDFEVFFKFTTGTLTSSTYTLFNFRTAAGQGDTERLCMNIINTTTCNTIFRTSSTLYYATDTPNIFSANTTYYIKYLYKNSYVTISLSQDNVNWTTLASGSISGTPSYSTSRWIGNSVYSQTNRYWRGTIDLKESYIVVAGVKYSFVMI